MRKINLGILGCGSIAQYAHLPAATKSSLINLIAVCDKRQDVMQAIACRYQVPETYTDHREFLKNADIEAVVLAVPDPLHVPLTFDCLKAGKHILIEKPLATNSEQGLKLLRAVDGSKLKVLVGNMKRHDPGIQFAKEFITRKMGSPLSISGWYCDTSLRSQLQKTLLLPPLHSSCSEPSAVDTKADKENYNLTTHGIHLVNTLQFLGGLMKKLAGKTAQRFDSDTWHAVVEYQSGAVGHFELTVKIRSDWSEGFEAHGEFGSVTGKTFLPFFKRPSEVRAFDIRTGISETPVGADSDPYKRQLDSFARSILEDQPIACTVADAIQDLRVLEALKRSINTSRWVEV